MDILKTGEIITVSSDEIMIDPNAQQQGGGQQGGQQGGEQGGEQEGGGGQQGGQQGGGSSGPNVHTTKIKISTKANKLGDEGDPGENQVSGQGGTKSGEKEGDRPSEESEGEGEGKEGEEKEGAGKEGEEGKKGKGKGTGKEDEDKTDKGSGTGEEEKKPEDQEYETETDEGEGKKGAGGEPEVSDIDTVMDRIDQHVSDLTDDLESEGSGGGSGGFDFLSNATLIPAVTKEIRKWLNLFQVGDVERTQYRPDVPNRRIPELWGRELTAIAREQGGKGKIEKVVCFILDLSGSMDPKLINIVVSRITLDLQRFKVVTKYYIVLFGGTVITSVPAGFGTLVQNVQKALAHGTDSCLDTAFKKLQIQMDENKFKVQTICIISDFELLGGSGKIPNDPKFNVPYLGFQLTPSNDTSYLKQWVTHNPNHDIFALSVNNNRMAIVKPIVAKKKRLL